MVPFENHYKNSGALNIKVYVLSMSSRNSSFSIGNMNNTCKKDMAMSSGHGTRAMEQQEQ